MFYYYIYSIYIFIYINTYINILHVQPILKRGKRKPKRPMRTWGGGESVDAHCEDSVSVCFVLFVLALHTLMHTPTHTEMNTHSLMGERGKHSSVCPVWGAAVAGLAALCFLLHTAGLIALTRTTLQPTTSFRGQFHLLFLQLHLTEEPAVSKLLKTFVNYPVRLMWSISFLNPENLAGRRQFPNKACSTYLSILCEMMVQQLGVGLLVWRQDVQEGCRGIARCTPRVHRSCPSQRWRQAEGRWRPCVEALLVKWLRITTQNIIIIIMNYYYTLIKRPGEKSVFYHFCSQRYPGFMKV